MGLLLLAYLPRNWLCQETWSVLPPFNFRNVSCLWSNLTLLSQAGCWKRALWQGFSPFAHACGFLLIPCLLLVSCSITVVVSSAPSLPFVSSLPLRVCVAFILAYFCLFLLAASPQPALDEEPHIREGNKVFGCFKREELACWPEAGNRVRSARKPWWWGGRALLPFSTKPRSLRPQFAGCWAP